MNDLERSRNGPANFLWLLISSETIERGEFCMARHLNEKADRRVVVETAQQLTCCSFGVRGVPLRGKLKALR